MYHVCAGWPHLHGRWVLRRWVGKPKTSSHTFRTAGFKYISPIVRQRQCFKSDLTSQCLISLHTVYRAKMKTLMATISCCGMPNKKKRAGHTLAGEPVFQCAGKHLLIHSQFVKCSILSSDSLDKQNLHCDFLIWYLLSVCHPLKWNLTLARWTRAGTCKHNHFKFPHAVKVKKGTDPSIKIDLTHRWA